MKVWKCHEQNMAVANIHSVYVRIPDKGIIMNNCHTFSVCQDPG